MNRKKNAKLILSCLCFMVCVQHVPASTRWFESYGGESEVFRPGSLTTGLFEDHSDVGDVLHPGSLEYDPSTETYVVSGSGRTSGRRRMGFTSCGRKSSATSP